MIFGVRSVVNTLNQQLVPKVASDWTATWQNCRELDKFLENNKKKYEEIMDWTLILYNLHVIPQSPLYRDGLKVADLKRQTRRPRVGPSCTKFPPFIKIRQRTLNKCPLIASFMLKTRHQLIIFWFIDVFVRIEPARIVFCCNNFIAIIVQSIRSWLPTIVKDFTLVWNMIEWMVNN